MVPNVRRCSDETRKEVWVEVLDDSLAAYGYAPGDRVPVHPGPAQGFLDVWELDGDLHARNLQSTGNGWTQACTRHSPWGSICFSLDPETNRRISRVGWLPTKEKSAG